MEEEKQEEIKEYSENTLMKFSKFELVDLLCIAQKNPKLFKRLKKEIEKLNEKNRQARKGYRDAIDWSG